MAKNRHRIGQGRVADGALEGLVEEGAAFAALQREARVPRPGRAERFDVIVIGAGQAGLSVGHYLAKRGRALRDPRRQRTHR